MRVTVIEGDPSEVKSVLQQYFSISPRSVSDAVSLEVDIADRQEASSRWTLAEFVRYWQLIKPDAQRFLAEVAAHPDGCHASVLKEKFGWSFNQLAGKLTSLEFQWKRFKGKPRVYYRDETRPYDNGHTYVALPDVTAFIEQLACPARSADCEG